MRGENTIEVFINSLNTGTSPRARGKPPRMAGVVMAGGNIPACAGKTVIDHPDSEGGGEHPRVRGENGQPEKFYAHPRGTSPRARGKLVCHPLIGFLQRNIPACAGKTGSPAGSKIEAEEHPRVRGENKSQTDSKPYANGTSPRARGKRELWHGTKTAAGNIPACAGKTRRVGILAARQTEHPRVRGENSLMGEIRNQEDGTSPRARGKLSLRANSIHHQRNIPTCAGKTVGRLRRHRGRQEHPRVRGENGTLIRMGPILRGTSPRARGKHVSKLQGVFDSGNIPACAGKTQSGHRPRR